MYTYLTKLLYYNKLLKNRNTVGIIGKINSLYNTE